MGRGMEKVLRASIKETRKRTPKGTAMVKPSVKEQPPAKVVIQGNTLSKLVLRGDLSGLSESETMEYYLRFCEHLGLDPVTRPFDLLVLNGKKVLYAHKGCTDQLRMKYGVSVTDLRGEVLQDCYRVTAIGRDHKGRTDAATGVVQVKGLQGDKFANAVMKAETKAKRRLTLSLCGLGMLDESEIETIPGAIAVDMSGEVKESLPTYDLGADDPTPQGNGSKEGRAEPVASDCQSFYDAILPKLEKLAPNVANRFKDTADRNLDQKNCDALKALLDTVTRMAGAVA